jgi:cytochrome c peroxidase
MITRPLPRRLPGALLVSAALLLSAALLVMAGLLAPAALPGSGQAVAADAGSAPDFTADERARILSHGPWPAAAAPDPGNRFWGQADAIALGERLFRDARLSGNETVACLSCHDPARGFTDGRARARGLADLDRNTQGLLDVGLQRWFGWDGGADSLWAASLRPLLAADEMGSDAARVARVLRTDPALADALARARAARPAASRHPTGHQTGHQTGRGPANDDDSILVDAARAIAAYLGTLVSPRTAFDDFRDALDRDDRAGAERYPASARRGLKLFVGRGNCGLCHFGPGFSNGEFHDIGIPFMPAPGRVDPGRHGGVARVRADPYNLLGRFADPTPGSPPGDDPAALKTSTATRLHRHFGEWRTPGLRGLSATAPYMHDGRLASLEAVISHYDTLDENRLHADGEALLRPLRLSAQERSDLLAFLRSLDPPESAPATRPAAPGEPATPNAGRARTAALR